MSNFKQTVIDLGTVKEHSINPAVFYKTPDAKPIVSATPACQCTAITVEQDHISTSYHANVVAEQSGGSMPINKRITVVFNDGTQEILSIVGTLSK